jgi:hypothetical protein
MASDDRITAEEFEKWRRVPEAIDLLASAFDPLAARVTLLKALRASVVTAVAERSSWANGGRQTLLSKVPAKHWEQITTDNFIWTTGDVSRTEQTIRHCGVTVFRFR